MLNINLAARRPNCAGFSRRDMLKIGALAPLGLGLPQLLSSEARASSAGGGGVAKAKSCILVFLSGGMSHHDTFDPKPNAPTEVRGPYGTIETSVPGLRIVEKLPEMAKVMDKVALVRSGSHDNDHHETAVNWVLSGRFGSPFGDWPAIGAVAAHETGFSGTLPPYVAVPNNPSFTWELGKSAYLGGRYESFKAGDPNAANYQVRDLAPPPGVSDASDARRRSLLGSLDTLDHRILGNDQLATFDEFQQRAAQIVLSPQAKSAFNIAGEPDGLRDRYGRNTFGQSCLMARRLVQSGVRFVTVNSSGWDTHQKIYPDYERRLPDFDHGLSSLLSDLDERGMLSDTLVAVFGEFGRSPKINKDEGRDHWGRAASMLFAGAGVQRGLVLGETDVQGGYVTNRPVRPADVAYTILATLGIDPHKFLATPDGRPVEILDEGEMLHELFA